MTATRRGAWSAAAAGILAAGLAGEPMNEKATPPARNRLAGATSPYLLQHAANPVDWYPWGPEALAAARTQDRPIFLSIGYSACHWCHVMEEESFEDPATASLMNGYFINIKVDREERPDLDDIYMTAVMMLTGSGGWPMSVWLTPDLKPFYGGTYFPKQPGYGRPSFTQVVSALGEAWRDDRGKLIAQAEQVHEAVAQHMTGRRTPPGGGPLGPELIARALEDLSGSFDHVHGGFGSAPKFPPHRALALMLARYRETKDENLLRMATLTLDRMADGGLYDQIGGGFHRYATDREWMVPHFEKMLYDNALLADVYIDAWLTTGRDRYRKIARETLGWALEEMRGSEGGFHSTLDADSEGEEGRFYVWTPDQVIGVLGPDTGGLINEHYGITPRGNFEGGASIPHVAVPLASLAEKRRLPAAVLEARIDRARATLRQAREKRPRPGKDDKSLAAWNGLMIASLARGSAAFGEPRWLEAATGAADFVLGRLRGPDGLMRVSYRDGRVLEEAFLDDQTFMIAGLVALHEAGGGRRWLDEARALAAATDRSFLDPAQGGYFFSLPDRRDLIVRAKNPTDGAIPSGNSMMAGALLAMHRATGEAAYRKRAGEILTAFRGGMEAMPGAFHNMLCVLHAWLAASPAAPARGAVVQASARALADTVAPGGRLPIEVTLTLKEGWHINSAKPTLPYLIPTSLAADAGSLAALEKTEYPEGRMSSPGFAGRPISLYEGEQVIRGDLRIDPEAPPGRRVIRLSLTYQACDDRACLPPALLPIDLGVTISPAAARP